MRKRFERKRYKASFSDLFAGALFACILWGIGGFLIKVSIIGADFEVFLFHILGIILIGLGVVVLLAVFYFA